MPAKRALEEPEKIANDCKRVTRSTRSTQKPDVQGPLDLPRPSLFVLGTFGKISIWHGWNNCVRFHRRPHDGDPLHPPSPAPSQDYFIYHPLPDFERDAPLQLRVKNEIQQRLVTLDAKSLTSYPTTNQFREVIHSVLVDLDVIDDEALPEKSGLTTPTLRQVGVLGTRWEVTLYINSVLIAETICGLDFGLRPAGNLASSMSYSTSLPPFDPIPPLHAQAGPSTSAASMTPSTTKTKQPKKPKNKDDKERKTRSRAACLPCKSTKQKCDGPSRIPCRRCQLYGLDCKFPSGAQIPPAPPPLSNQGGIEVGSSTDSDNSGVVARKLFEIADRLKSIEAALHVDDGVSNGTSPMHESSHSPSPPFARSPSPTFSDDANDEAHNPIQIINRSLDEVVGQPSYLRVMGTMTDDYGAPDALRRNLLTPKECQELFDFFFLCIHPWVMMLSLDEDRDALGVRSRSPLLFHTILLLASSYSNPFPSHLHASLITFTNAIIAPQILSPQPHELTTDFLRAVDLLNLYKPTQFAARRAEGKDDIEAMRASKVNGMASWMLQGILARTAERLDLASVTNRFMRAFNASKKPADIPPTVLRDLRLYYWLLSNDVHGNVQSGRRCNMEGAHALATTRAFSSLQLQPYDVRLAASVEMFEVARPILRSHTYERTRRIARADLERYNTGMQAWEEFWIPVLMQQQGVDPLAMSVLCPFQWFITLTFNAAGYLSWQQDKLYLSDSSGENTGPEVKPNRKMRAEARGLSPWEFEALAKCVNAAEGLIFTLCEESRVKQGWRTVQWREAERPDGYRKLTLDQTVVEISSWGMDAITCIAYVFPLVFLTRLVHDGLLSIDLELVTTPVAQHQWSLSRKLPRLLELGAAFLDAVALNPNHPAKSQAQVMRTLLEAGLEGVSPSPSMQRPGTAGPGTGVGGVSPTSSSGLAVPAQMVYAQDPPGGQWTSTPQMTTGGVSSYGYPGLQPPLQAQPHRDQHSHPQQHGLSHAAASLDHQSLSSVLETFDPSLFGEANNFWEWGGTGAGMGVGDVDWSAVQGSLRSPM